MTRWIRPLIATSLLAAFTLAQALTITPYTPQALATAQKAGQPVAVQFHAEWCPTCKLQEKALNQMVAEPGLDITVLVADYDKEKDLRKSMNVRTQSTMVVFKGTEEKARLAGETAPDKIRSVLKSAL